MQPDIRWRSGARARSAGCQAAAFPKGSNVFFASEFRHDRFIDQAEVERSCQLATYGDVSAW